MADVQLNSVKKTYDKTEVVHGVDLDIKSGEFVVFVGPSGCGKSTLLRMIAGLEEITEGEISIGGEVVNNVIAAERGVAMVFQSYALYPHMTVFENMSFALKQAKAPKDEIQQRVTEAAKILQIENLFERLPKQLSGGQRQRVAIGRAIVRDPKVFLFDEPLSNLDAALRVQTRIEIAKLHSQLTATMIYVTHDQVEAMTLADRIVVLNQGIIEQVGTPIELYSSPKNQFVAEFIGSPKMNILEVKEENVVSENTIKILGNDIQFDKLKLNKSKHFVGIRPEHLKANQNTKFTFNPEIELIENLGNEKIVYMKKDEHQLSAKIPSNVEIGSSIGFDLNDIFIFDENGKRLKS